MLVGTENDCHATRRRLKALLYDQFDIEHTTLQVDHESDELLGITSAPPADACRRGEWQAR
jgi:cobalt-zinc-cadmium efflux system protein